MMDIERLKGIHTALVSPFFDGKLDLDSFEKLIRQQLQSGIQGFVVGGTTGESPNLSESELERLCKCAIQTAHGSVPITVGTGSNSTDKSIQLSKKAQNWGVDSLLLVTPYYNNPTQDGVYAHFKAIAQTVDIPIIIYNVPARTVIHLEAATIERLAEIRNVVAIKEASGNISFAKELLNIVSKDFFLTSGDDKSCSKFLSSGGEGVISVVSHVIPKEMVNIFNMAKAKDPQLLSEFSKFQSLLQNIYIEPNPVPVKEALCAMGILKSPEVRLPLVAMKNDSKMKLFESLNSLGKI